MLASLSEVLEVMEATGPTTYEGSSFLGTLESKVLVPHFLA